MKKVLPIIVFTLIVSLVPASTLSGIASQMQAGTWAEVPQTNIGAVLGGGAHTGNLAPYAMSAAWDPEAKRLHFLGGDHGCPSGYQTHVYYDDATNAWTSLGPVSQANSCHGYDHVTIDVTNRMLYCLPPTYSNPPRVLRYNLAAGGGWTQMGTSNATGYNQVSQGVAWWSGPLSGAGSAGALLHYNCGQPDGEIALYDPNANAWASPVIRGFGGTSTYHGMAEYSRVKNCAVMGGGNYNPKKLWRLNSDKSVTAMPDAPVDLGIQRGNVVPDPVTGNFLVMGYGQLWELDPSGSGRWTRQTGTRVPPSAVGNPGSPDLNSVISAEITNYGVDMYVTCRAANCNMYIYKHAAGSMEAEGLVLAAEKHTLTVYPNPVRGRAVVGARGVVSIYDVRGNRVAMLGKRGVWNAAGVPAGVYLVKAMDGNQILSRRVIVE